MCYKPIDVDFVTKQVTFVDLIDSLQRNLLTYTDDGIVDIKILEFAILKAQFEPIVCRFNHKKDITDENGHYKLAYDVYRGSGLLRTLKYYVILDMPMRGFVSLPDIEGLRFSELPNQFKRRIKETYIYLIIDRVSSTSNKEIIEDYVSMLQSAV